MPRIAVMRPATVTGRAVVSRVAEQIDGFGSR